MLRWEQTEFLLKGLYLGLLVLIAWQNPTPADNAWQIALYAVGGLAVCLSVAAFHKFREGYRVRGRWLGVILFLILENPGMVYTGIILGLAFGTYMTFREPRTPSVDWDSLYFVIGGAALGIAFYFMRHVRDRRVRLYLGLALGLA